MIKRTILEKLRVWKESSGRKPLILRGVRQVGKTTLVTEFAKEYDTFLHLNLERESDRILFEQTDDVQLLIRASSWTWFRTTLLSEYGRIHSPLTK